jgi:MFS family permease
MFPQLGAPLGFLLSAGIFLVLGRCLSQNDFLQWGWRIPFVASALLVGLGLWVRLNIHETPDFKKALERKAPVRLPMWTVLRDHPVPMLLGTLGAFATFVLFYLMTVFSLGHGTAVLGYSREQFLLMQMAGMLFFALGIPLSARYGDRGARAHDDCGQRADHRLRRTVRSRCSSRTARGWSPPSCAWACS